MSESYRATLTRLLADPAAEEWRLAAQVLQQTFAWCATVATPDHLRDRIAALSFLFELQTALADGSAYLTLVPAIMEQAIPGQTLETSVAEARVTLDAHAHKLTQLRKDLQIHEQQEKQWRNQIEEQGKLEARLAELKRLSRLAAEAEALRQQVETVEQHRSAAERDVEQMEAWLREHSQGLVTMLEQHLVHVQEQVRTSLVRAAALEAELLGVVAEWQAAYARYQDLETVLAEHREVLRLHQEADQAVAQALGETVPGVRNAQELLNRLQQFLEQADQILAKALEAHAKADQASRLYVGGGRQ